MHTSEILHLWNVAMMIVGKYQFPRLRLGLSGIEIDNGGTFTRRIGQMSWTAE